MIHFIFRSSTYGTCNIDCFYTKSNYFKREDKQQQSLKKQTTNSISILDSHIFSQEILSIYKPLEIFHRILVANYYHISDNWNSYAFIVGELLEIIKFIIRDIHLDNRETIHSILQDIDKQRTITQKFESTKNFNVPSDENQFVSYNRIIKQQKSKMNELLDTIAIVIRNKDSSKKIFISFQFLIDEFLRSLPYFNSDTRLLYIIKNKSIKDFYIEHNNRQIILELPFLKPEHLLGGETLKIIRNSVSYYLRNSIENEETPDVLIFIDCMDCLLQSTPNGDAEVKILKSKKTHKEKLQFLEVLFSNFKEDFWVLNSFRIFSSIIKNISNRMQFVMDKVMSDIKLFVDSFLSKEDFDSSKYNWFTIQEKTSFFNFWQKKPKKISLDDFTENLQEFMINLFFSVSHKHEEINIMHGMSTEKTLFDTYCQFFINLIEHLRQNKKEAIVFFQHLIDTTNIQENNREHIQISIQTDKIFAKEIIQVNKILQEKKILEKKEDKIPEKPKGTIEKQTKSDILSTAAIFSGVGAVTFAPKTKNQKNP